MDWVRLSSIEFDWIRFVRKSNSLKVWCSISFDCRTQSNSIHGLSLIEFNFRTFDLLCRVSNRKFHYRFSEEYSKPITFFIKYSIHADVLLIAKLLMLMYMYALIPYDLMQLDSRLGFFFFFFSFFYYLTSSLAWGSTQSVFETNTPAECCC